MSYPIEFGEHVEQEILEAVTWYDLQRPGLGDQLVNVIASAIDRVADTPFAFPLVHNQTRRAAVRRFPYSAYFRVHDARIAILAVLHNSRDPRLWQTRS